jgi:hypothetical protein
MTPPNKFPTSVNLNSSWVRPEPGKKTDKQKTQEFWGLCVPAGFGAAVIIALLCGSPEVFLPAWPVLSIIIWGLKSGLDGENG